MDEGGKCWMEWERSEKCMNKLLKDADSYETKPQMKYLRLSSKSVHTQRTILLVKKA